MNFIGLDERLAEKLTREFGVKMRGPVAGLPEEILSLVFILLFAFAGFILGYNFYRLFKAK
ncbi:MAG: hypothetical protein NC898_02050 [Candidatus Omnitrophica bacterium]|nr:hypothetical protein [Candidatus Omnitrophota bacterium]MCM8793235.1 hypothetical protein [Candidatus Omnitrophota bacterium]